MIKAIIFDFGRVISAQKPMSLFRSYEKDLGLSPSTLNRTMFGSPAWQEVLTGRKTADDYWREIGPALGLHTFERSICTKSSRAKAHRMERGFRAPEARTPNQG